MAQTSYQLENISDGYFKLASHLFPTKQLHSIPPDKIHAILKKT